jgi:protein-S-isoprenylcysteine O-methyltransferase Ste14
VSRGLLPRAGHALFKTRDVLFPVVLLLVALGTRPRLVRGDVRLDHWIDAAGFLVALSGEALRTLVIGLEYITRGGQNRQVWANSLVAGGMFAHSRNPLYVGNLLIITGLAIVHNGWAMYLFVLPLFLLIYAAIVAAEEEYLHERFGDAYTEYCQRVPRWFPSLRGLAATVRAGRFDWLRVLRKEYGTPFAWMSGFFLLLIWEHHSPAAAPMGSAEVRFIASAWIVLAVAYLITRTLKLRGYIGTT